MTSLPPMQQAPHNIEAEQELLGAILVNNEAYWTVNTFLKPDHFYHQLHREIYAACGALISEGKVANPVTLKTYFEGNELLEKAGGTAYLVRLAAVATSVINAEDYAKVILDLAVRRELIQLGESLIARASSAKLDEAADQIAAETDQKLTQILDTGVGDDIPLISIYEAASAGLNEADRRQRGEFSGILTRIPAVDELLGVIEEGDLLILGGRPSMGKSALAWGIAMNVAGAGEPVLFFSLEMNERQLGQRGLSNLSGVPYSAMRKVNRLTQADMDRMVAASKQFRSMPLTLVTKRNLQLRHFEAVVRKWKRQTGGRFVVIDYLQLVRADDRYRGNREAEVAEVSRGLKRISGDLGVATLCLSQLSRAVEARTDKRPQLGDLRESGSIEQDADTVMFCFREEYYLERAEPKQDTQEWFTWKEQLEATKGVMEVIIPKVRQGEIGVAKVWFDAATNSFKPINERGLPDPRQADLALEPPSYATEFAPLES